uniref:Uncharacterized protein n=1 Tax=Romanomermis culicivorax TaxID=13658 RepID=A0A915IN22_ROMCU
MNRLHWLSLLWKENRGKAARHIPTKAGASKHYKAIQKSLTQGSKQYEQKTKENRNTYKEKYNRASSLDDDELQVDADFSAPWPPCFLNTPGTAVVVTVVDAPPPPIAVTAHLRLLALVVGSNVIRRDVEVSVGACNII